MSKKKSIDDEEQRLFREAVRGAQPLPHETVHPKAPRAKKSDPTAKYRRQQASEEKISPQEAPILVNPTFGAEDRTSRLAKAGAGRASFKF